MFIKFLIVIFMFFIVYLFFSNDMQEGFKGKKRKLRLGKKGGLKMRGGSKKKPTPAADPDEEDADPEAEPDAADPNDVQALIDKLRGDIQKQQKQLDDLTDLTQQNAVTAAQGSPTVSTNDMAEEDNGDLGI